MAARRRSAVVVALLAAGLLLSACSDDGDSNASDLVANAQARQYKAEQNAQRQIEQANAALPDRPSGELDIDGSPSFSLTSHEVDAYLATGTNTTINLAQNGADQGFQELCAGKIDLVTSLRPISRSEWDACQSVGLDVVQFQIASDGIVVAIKSESDVGGDCLNTDQIRETWRAGSPITNWSQLGLDDIPLRTAGPPASSSDFQLFGQTVLGSPAPSQTDFRSDEYTYQRFQDARRFLSGSRHHQHLALTYPDEARLKGLRKSQLLTARQVYFDAASAVRDARAERAKGIRDHRSAADQAKDVARLQAAIVKRNRLKHDLEVARHKYLVATHLATAAADAKREVDGSLGHVIYTRFSTYELFEEELRPFEITYPNGQRNCVFPSQSTITSGVYPLSQQVLVTTTTQALQRSEVTGFLHHYLKDAQAAASDADLIALPDQTLQAELAWLDGSRQAPLTVPENASGASPSATPTDGTTAKPAR